MNAISRRLLRDVVRYYAMVAAFAVSSYLVAYAIRGHAPTPLFPWLLMVLGAITVACMPAFFQMISSRKASSSERTVSVRSQMLKEVGIYYFQITMLALFSYLMIIVVFRGWNWIPLHGWIPFIICAGTLAFIPGMLRMVQNARAHRANQLGQAR